MALLVPNVGEAKMLGYIVNNATGMVNPTLRLFSNNQTPTSTQTIADYTEATFTGYAAVIQTGSSWTITAGDGSTGFSKATTNSASTFTCSGTTSQSVYGYYVDANTSTLLWAERFSDGPYTIANVGDKVIITPVLTLSTT